MKILRVVRNNLYKSGFNLTNTAKEREIIFTTKTTKYTKMDLYFVCLVVFVVKKDWNQSKLSD